MVRVSVLACVLFLATGAVGPGLLGQVPENQDLRRFVDVYFQGGLTEADEGIRGLLEGALEGVPDRDVAIAHAYLGLVLLARGDEAGASEMFERAFRRHFPLELDPGLHAPSRIRSFEAVRIRLARGIQFHSPPTSLEQERSVRLALRFTGLPDVEPEEDRVRWTSLDPSMAEVGPDGMVRPASPEGGPLEVIAEWTSPDGETVFQARTTITVVAARRTAGAGKTLATGMLLPGAGQFFVGRPGRGLLTIGAVGGALALGVLSEEVEVLCGSPALVGGRCPQGQILEEDARRPHMALGLGVAGAITVLSALDAFRADGRQDPGLALGVGRDPGTGEVRVAAHLRFPVGR